MSVADKVCVLREKQKQLEDQTFNHQMFLDVHWVSDCSNTYRHVKTAQNRFIISKLVEKLTESV